MQSLSSDKMVIMASTSLDKLSRSEGASLKDLYAVVSVVLTPAASVRSPAIPAAMDNGSAIWEAESAEKRELHPRVKETGSYSNFK